MMLRLASVDDQGQIDGDGLAVRGVGTACCKNRDEDQTPGGRETRVFPCSTRCTHLEVFTFVVFTTDGQMYG